MKLLTLIRHAKSSWDHAGLADFDRPLNGRGRKGARLIGQHLGAEHVSFDRIIASPATRVRETLADLLAATGSKLPKPNWDERIYLASSALLLDLIQETPDKIGHLAIAGHNPGLHELAVGLVGKGNSKLRVRLADKFPTAAIATLAFDINRWSDADWGSAKLERFTRPRDLDSALGPID